MKKNIELTLILIAAISIILALIAGFYGPSWYERAIKYAAAVVVFNFFMYKLFVGWLIINLTIKAEAQRLPVKDGTEDHLTIKITLSKGTTDSLWLEDIQVRISEVTQPENIPVVVEPVIHPVNFKKRTYLPGVTPEKDDWWGGIPQKHYTLSSGEETFFTAYTRAKPDTVLCAEIVVIGTRPFYAVERKKNPKIQWRASLMILPLSGPSTT
ncbi:hypothetical protein FMM05_20285 [Flavobacterium zepuense]|uniref:Uncharacterized protein n=1 Tax=Flavobacterium zepuense TaxID=2593302 RepID=A0A552UTD4_9FLAO|nr:hypothetical protein [Flavobacterium zepuense]TRW21491.1 hypothetical protein FMM05_20285 [Flavobacterium zepuense]